MGSGGLKSVWLNMGFSSGLTLQMDLIVLRNSIFCHSACMLCVPAPAPPQPFPRPSCRQRGPLSPELRVCGNEESGSARDQTAGRGEEGGIWRYCPTRSLPTRSRTSVRSVKCANTPNPPPDGALSGGRVYTL